MEGRFGEALGLALVFAIIGAIGAVAFNNWTPLALANLASGTVATVGAVIGAVLGGSAIFDRKSDRHSRSGARTHRGSPPQESREAPVRSIEFAFRAVALHGQVTHEAQTEAEARRKANIGDRILRRNSDGWEYVDGEDILKIGEPDHFARAKLG